MITFCFKEKPNLIFFINIIEDYEYFHSLPVETKFQTKDKVTGSLNKTSLKPGV